MDIPIQKPLVDVFRWRVTKSPNLIVHKFQQRETTYSQFDIFANKVAQGLIKEGCKPNSRVAYLAKNSDLYFHYANFFKLFLVEMRPPKNIVKAPIHIQITRGL